LLSDASVFGVELSTNGHGSGIIVRTSERSTLTHHLPRAARDAGIRLLEIRPTDESLESVFSYLVER